MAEFTKSDDATIAEFRAVYEMIPAGRVGEFFEAGWRPVSPLIAMAAPTTLDGRGLNFPRVVK